MKNRAKCKLCETVIESIHSQDYQMCQCREIFVDGGKENLCGAKDWNNFLRVDDNGNVIVPKIVEGDSDEVVVEQPDMDPNEKKDNLIGMMKNLIDSYENLPPNARFASISHYDLQAALLIIYEIVRIK